MRPPGSPRRPHTGVDDQRFTCNDATADAATAAWIRDGFADWLGRCTGLDETRLCDVVLSINEALANAAEFAYPPGRTGSVDVQAALDRERRTLTVTVADRGRWRESDLLSRRSGRGRGMPLMRTLADAVVLDTSALGTIVGMRFDNVQVGHRAVAAAE